MRDDFEHTNEPISKPKPTPRPSPRPSSPRPPKAAER